MDGKKLIYAEDFISSLRDDPLINGANFKRVVQHINDANAVDAVEVVHGRWIKGDGFKNMKFIPCSSILYCSNCKNEAYWDTDYGQQKFDYCHNCGAKMDGGNEDGAL